MFPSLHVYNFFTILPSFKEDDVSFITVFLMVFVMNNYLAISISFSRVNIDCEVEI